MLAPKSHPTVRVAALDGLTELLGAAGIEFRDLLRRLGIDPLVLSEPDNRLKFRQFVQVLNAAADAIADDCLGLHLGAAQSLHVAGVLGYALQAASGVSEQLAHAERYFALHQDGAAIELHTKGENATLSYAVFDDQVTLHRHDAEATVALCVNQWRVHTGLASWAPSSVHFEHPAPRPESERELRRYFGCPVLFSEPSNSMCFPSSFLSTPIRSADPGLHQILMRYADECLSRHADSATLTGRTRRLIAAGLSNGNASMEGVARRMAITPRTLQRRLADEGLQFGDLVDETRRELATQYLRDDRITLTDTAFLVGYSDLTAFHRAFRRWFHQTPLDYRRQLKTLSVSS